MADLPAKVAASLTRYNMLEPGDRVGVAVSGGADSVTLLHILHGLHSYALQVLHVNHQLRGPESDDDENFVRELATRLSLPFEVKRAPIPEGNMEQLARDARRAFFHEARQHFGLKCIALGHNETDQAETVLYRFMRGSGLSGLSGMRPVSADGLVRPMLDVTREEIRAWATDQGLAWREDSSNRNTELVRNRIRLEMINPQLVRVLAATATVARDEEDWWTGRIEQKFELLVRWTRLGLEVQTADLRALHPAEQRRLIRRAVRQVKGDLRSVDLVHVEAIRNLLATDAGHDRILIPGADALRSFGTLLLARPGTIGAEPRHYRQRVEIGEEVALPHGNGSLYVKRMKPEDRFCGNFGVEAQTPQEIADLDEEALSRSAESGPLEIRNWEPGDEYSRAGHRKAEKIKSLFQEYRILLWDRRRWPVLAAGEKIVWSRRFGAAAEFQANDASRSIVRILYSAGE